MKTDTIKTSWKEKRVINATHLVLSFLLTNALAGVWNETSSGNRSLKINESVIIYFIKCFKMSDRKPVLYTKRNCMTIVKPVYVHVLHVVNKPERTNIYSCITWFRQTKRILVIQHACLIWISTKKSESWGFANGSRAHIYTKYLKIHSVTWSCRSTLFTQYPKPLNYASSKK